MADTGEERNGFIIVREFAPALSKLSTMQKGEVFEALLADLEGRPMPINMDPFAAFALDLILPTIRKHQRTFALRKNAARENGRRGGRPPKEAPETEGNPEVSGETKGNPPVSMETKGNQIGFAETKGNQVGFPSPDRMGLDGIGLDRNGMDRSGVDKISLSSDSDAAPPPSVPPSRDASVPEREPARTPPKPRIDLRLLDFEQWYSEYPKHEKRAEAQRAWEKAVRSGKLPPLAALLETLSWQKHREQWREYKYVPLPASYLNAQSWLDEKPKASPSPPPRSSPYRRPSPEEQTFQENQRNAAAAVASLLAQGYGKENGA